MSNDWREGDLATYRSCSGAVFVRIDSVDDRGNVEARVTASYNPAYGLGHRFHPFPGFLVHREA